MEYLRYQIVFFGITAGFAFLGGQSVFRSSNNKIVIIKNEDKRNIATIILLTVVVGVVLGMINLYFISTGMEKNPGFSLERLLTAFRAGVTEEIIFRFFLFAICVHITKDKVLSKSENIVCYCLMTIPHALTHFTLYNINIVSAIGLFLIFGLPFALLQRKRDLATAMGSHFIIDIMRFYVFRT